MAEKRIIQLKIDPELHSWITEWAKNNRRTITNQIISTIIDLKANSEKSAQTNSQGNA